MAEIKLSPEMLMAQSMELAALQGEYETLFSQVSNILSIVNENWSENLAKNFSGKIQSAQKSFSSIANMLTNGAAAARISSSTFAAGVGINNILESLLGEEGGGLAKWIQEQGVDLSEGSADWIGQMLSVGGLDGEKIQSVMEMMAGGDAQGALKMLYSEGIDWAAGTLTQGVEAGSWVDIVNQMSGGTLGFDKLENAYWKNMIGDTAGSGVEAIQSLVAGENGDALRAFGKMAWNASAGSVIKTAGDAAFDLASSLPWVGDYYREQGAADFESGLGVMMKDVAYAITGDAEEASAIGSYYSDHGGIASGIVDGVVEIGSYVGEQLNNWWGSIFG